MVFAIIQPNSQEIGIESIRLRILICEERSKIIMTKSKNTQSKRIQPCKKQTTHRHDSSTNEVQTNSKDRIENKDMNTNEIKNSNKTPEQTTSPSLYDALDSFKIKVNSKNMDEVCYKITKSVKSALDNIHNDQSIPSVISNNENLLKIYRNVVKDTYSLNDLCPVDNSDVVRSIQACMNKNNLYAKKIYEHFSNIVSNDLAELQYKISKSFGKDFSVVFKPILNNKESFKSCSDNLYTDLPICFNGTPKEVFGKTKYRKVLQDAMYKGLVKRIGIGRDARYVAVVPKEINTNCVECNSQNYEEQFPDFNVSLKVLDSILSTSNSDGIFHLPNMSQIPEDNLFITSGVIEKINTQTAPISKEKFDIFSPIWGDEIKNHIDNKKLSPRHILCDTYKIDKKNLAILCCKALGLQENPVSVQCDTNLWHLGCYNKGYNIYLSPFYGRKQEHKINKSDKYVVITSSGCVVDNNIDVSIAQVFAENKDKLCSDALKRFVRNKTQTKTTSKKDEAFMRMMDVISIIIQYTIEVIEKKLPIKWIGAKEILTRLKIRDKKKYGKIKSVRTIQKDIKKILNKSFKFNQQIQAIYDAFSVKKPKKRATHEILEDIASMHAITEMYRLIANGKY